MYTRSMCTPPTQTALTYKYNHCQWNQVMWKHTVQEVEVGDDHVRATAVSLLHKLTRHVGAQLLDD